MKKVLILASLTVFFMSCKKSKYCYECNAENINTSAIDHTKSACGLTLDDREKETSAFKASYDAEYNVSCLESTED